MATSILQSPATAPIPPDDTKPPSAATPIPLDAAAKPPKKDFPCPISYEEIHREAIMSLKPEEFTEGMRHDLVIRYNKKFCIYNSIMMGHTVIPSQSSKIIKTPTSSYEFGANYRNSKLMLLGRMTMGGKSSVKFKYNFTHNLTLKVNAQLTATGKPHCLITYEYKGRDYRAQFQMGGGALLGATYIQSVSPHLSLGTEVFRAGRHGKYTFGHALRYHTNKMVSAAHYNGRGMVTLSYVHKASEKVSLVSDFICNSMSKDVTASFGYDYKHCKGRVRAKIDSKGVVACLLQQNNGFSFSFEIDNKKQDHKLGLRLSCGRDYHTGEIGRNSYMMNSFNFS